MRNYPKSLSFIIPLYNERSGVEALRERLSTVAQKVQCPCEWILVDDGSTDGTTEILVDWAKSDGRAQVIQLSRNFGHQAATTAGLDIVRTEVAILMDGDLQDPPELAMGMIHKYQAGFDVVYGKRSRRVGEGWIKRLTAFGYYWLMKKFIHSELPENAGDFRLMSMPVIRALRQMRESHRFIRGMIPWLGFAQTSIEFDRPARVTGSTKFSLQKMIRFASDGIISFSSLPLRMVTVLGLSAIFCGACMSVYTIVRQLFFGGLVPGWSSLVVLEVMMGGAILLSLGIIGEYVGRIYDEIKRRPLYVVRQIYNAKLLKTPDRAVVPGCLELDERDLNGRVDPRGIDLIKQRS